MTIILMIVHQCRTLWSWQAFTEMALTMFHALIVILSVISAPKQVGE